MTKTELISAMAAECSLSKTDAGKALDAFMHQVTVALASGEKVILAGFGVFEVKERAERTGRNPQTKEEILIPASRTPSFKPGKPLKEVMKADAPLARGVVCYVRAAPFSVLPI